MATNDEVYPGHLNRYRELRARRIQEEVEHRGEPLYIGLLIAEELAGLAYLINGTNYLMRQEKK